jgi:hypothetical protein
LRSKTQALIIDLAHRTGIAPFIAPGVWGTKRDDRQHEFVSRLSHYTPKQLEKLFQAAAPVLAERYMPAENLREEDYEFNWNLDIEGISLVRTMAAKCKIDPSAYSSLEHRALKKWQEGRISQSQLIDWMLEQLEKLPTVEKIPDVPLTFKLEEFLIQRFA